jgi:Cdc6-like AAA superfamily ATPase
LNGQKPISKQTNGKLVKINFEDVKSHNLLVAGLPGTGKTMLLKLILKQLLSNTELNTLNGFYRR